MEPTNPDIEDNQDSINYTPTWNWYRNQGHDFYRYVKDDDGAVQKIYDDPRHYSGKSSSKTPPPKPPSGAPASKKPAPVTFLSPHKPSKYYLEDQAPPIVGVEFGPTKLETSDFHSQGEEGVTAWHCSQFMRDLDRPPSETLTPANLATLYVHRNLKDGGYQVWIWLEQNGVLGWQPVDMKNLFRHPEFPGRVLRLTAAGKPSWILQSSLVTGRTRQQNKKKYSQSRQGSLHPDPSGKPGA